MNMRDTTVEANSGENMADYYLYHVQSEENRWALAVEQTRGDRFHVSVLMSEPGWDVFGAVRYWVFEERALAEARYLELQRLMADIDEQEDMKAVLAKLPAAERIGPRGDED
jgi:hypothetical protein